MYVMVVSAIVRYTNLHRSLRTDYHNLYLLNEFCVGGELYKHLRAEDFNRFHRHRLVRSDAIVRLHSIPLDNRMLHPRYITYPFTRHVPTSLSYSHQGLGCTRHKWFQLSIICIQRCVSTSPSSTTSIIHTPPYILPLITGFSLPGYRTSRPQTRKYYVHCGGLREAWRYSLPPPRTPSWSL